jgi:hypothetical protein
LWKVVAHLIRENKYKTVFFYFSSSSKNAQSCKNAQTVGENKNKAVSNSMGMQIRNCIKKSKYEDKYETVFKCTVVQVPKKLEKTNTKLTLSNSMRKQKRNRIKQLEKTNTKLYYWEGYHLQKYAFSR